MPTIEEQLKALIAECNKMERDRDAARAEVQATAKLYVNQLDLTVCSRAEVECLKTLLDKTKDLQPNVVTAIRERDAALSEVERRKANDLYMSTEEIQAGIDRRIAAEAEVARLHAELVESLDESNRLKAKVHELTREGHIGRLTEDLAKATDGWTKSEEVGRAAFQKYKAEVDRLEGDLAAMTIDKACAPSESPIPTPPKTKTKTIWRVIGDDMSQTFALRADADEHALSRVQRIRVTTDA